MLNIDAIKKEIYIKDDIFGILTDRRREHRLDKYYDTCKLILYSIIRIINIKRRQEGVSRENSFRFDDSLYIHIESLNNYRTTKFLEEEFDVKYCGKSKNEYCNLDVDFSSIIIRSPLGGIKLLYFLWLIITPTRSVKHFKAIDKYFNCLEEFHKILRVKKPKGIVFSNDHNPVSRALIFCCQQLKIPTFYIQHGSVSKYFPKLIFSVAFLRGENDYDIYREVGPIRSKVILSGSHFSIKRGRNFVRGINEIKCIGLAYNLLDRKAELIELVSILLNKFSPNVEIIIRAHPRDSRFFDWPEEGLNRISFSDSRIEDPLIFLKKCDVLVTGTSGIAFEAVMNRVITIQCNLGAKQVYDDYYGFVSKGLITMSRVSHRIYSDIERAINNSPTIDLLCYYDRSQCKENDENSNLVIVREIQKWIK